MIISFNYTPKMTKYMAYFSHELIRACFSAQRDLIIFFSDLRIFLTTNSYHLGCTRHSANCFSWITSFQSLTPSLMRYSPFRDVDTERQRLSYPVGRGSTSIQCQVHFSPMSRLKRTTLTASSHQLTVQHMRHKLFGILVLYECIPPMHC